MPDSEASQIFREEAQELLSELETALLELEGAPDDADAINRVFRALHTIKGSGAMFGFEKISRFAHEVETVFDKVRNGEMAVCRDLLSLALRSKDHVALLLEDEAGADEEERDIVTGLQALLIRGAADGPSAEEAPEAVAAPAIPRAPSPADPSPAPTPERPQGEEAWLIRLTPKAGARLATGSMLSTFEGLRAMGELRLEAAGLDSLPDLEQADPLVLYHSWEAVLVTEQGRDAILDQFLMADIPMDVVVERADAVAETPSAVTADGEFPPDPDLEDEGPKKLGEILVEKGFARREDVERALSAQKPLGKILAESGVVTEDQVEQALAEQSRDRAAKVPARDAAKDAAKDAASSIRVAAEKLDKLVDLVGEMVIVQAQISQVAGSRNDPQMSILAEQLERLSNELRDSTLGIRMLPIGTTFSKFRRLVRDLSGEMGKEINLTTRGAETELDKTVIERLGDPLVHLIRNSIDHALEPPEERVAAGKPRAGTIILSAEHSGGDVLIQIRDDGRGIDTEAVRRKAAERGLISPDADLSDKAVFDLIFQPGFSTAKKVTSVSGRGVGMDVVKRAIDALRGSIDIDSERGRGTIITIKLPLTLAIIDGLQIQVGDGFFVIPLSLVEECVELHRKDEEEWGDRRFINLRGEIVPYVRIREFFEIEGERPEIEQVVICGADGSQVGIVVDNVIGEHQTVIKSLGRVYRDVEGISGATIRGDGTLALILDVPRLVRSYQAVAS